MSPDYITNKTGFLQSLLLFSKSIDIVCITETWLTNMISDPEIIPSNYTIYRNDRYTRGGGVLIAISMVLVVSQLS